MTAARQCYERRGNGPRIHRNAVVFLAPDRTKRQDLLEATAAFLAWKSIFDDRESLGLDPHNRNLAEKKTEDFERTVEARIQETWQWILVPEQSEPTIAVEWKETRVGGADPLPEKVFKRLKRDGLLADQLAGSVLRLHLDKILWRDKPHIEVAKVLEYFSQYVYLPRVVGPETLITAISEGIATLTWETDTFAYAERFDEEANRYAGLHAAQSGLRIPAEGPGVIVKPEAARLQLTTERGGEEKPAGESATPAGVEEPAAPSGDSSGESPPPARRKLTRFHGSVLLKPSGASLQFADIENEVIQHFTSDVKTKVRITIEIEAENEDGFNEFIRRSVLENSGVFRFESSEFEES